MKKSLLLLFVAVSFATSPAFAEGMMAGVKGGLNFANLIGDNVEEAASKTSFVGGAFLCYPLTEIFAIQPELLFTMKGAKNEDSEDDESWNINYIEIPILLKVALPTEGNVDPSLYVGPGFGFLLSSKVSNGGERDLKDETEGFDIGLIVGAGVDYQLEAGALSLEARYEVGMTTLAKEEDDSGEKLDINNSVISIMVGYGFKF